MAPLAVATAPAHGEDAVEEFAQAGFAAVANRGEVGDHAEVPEDQGDREIGRDREDVPEQGRFEVLPDRVGIRDRCQEPGEPHAADVEGRENAGTDHREDRHRLGGAVDRGAPVLAGEEEHGGDQRAGVADTDPEHEVGDVPAPEDAVGHAPDADAAGDEVGEPAADADEGDEGGRDEEQPPEERLPVFKNSADPLGDPVVGAVVEDELFAFEYREFDFRLAFVRGWG